MTQADMGFPITIFIANKGDSRSSQERLIASAQAWCVKRGQGAESLSVLRPKHGKPFFENAPNLHFSVTHSGDFWLCAVSSQPLGLDLQQIKKTQTMKIARRYFHPEETEYLAHHPETFFSLWTAKESFVKLTGRGIDDGFSDFSVVSGGEIQNAPEGAKFRFLPFVGDYVLCLCCEDPSDLEFMETPRK